MSLGTISLVLGTSLLSFGASICIFRGMRGETKDLSHLASNTLALRSAIESKGEELTNLQTDLTQAESKISELNVKIQTSEDELANTKSKIEELLREKELSLSQAEVLNQQVGELQNKVKSLESENLSLQHRVVQSALRYSEQLSELASDYERERAQLFSALKEARQQVEEQPAEIPSSHEDTGSRALPSSQLNKSSGYQQNVELQKASANTSSTPSGKEQNDNPSTPVSSRGWSEKIRNLLSNTRPEKSNQEDTSNQKES
ncbi:calcium binding and coiled-coil domain (CALCOCO1) like family protein [Chlamydia ibidis 10-1398/6]|nr:calcium binding and coiled-coil domain (CALCOCO1) like family protein [Chlamydia ibidis 10-1398/6]